MTTLLIAASLAADLLTASVDREANPLARAIMEGGFGLAVKVAEIVLVLAAVAIIRRRRPALALGVAWVAVVGGVVGTWSNL